jgi:hypothetical protein
MGSRTIINELGNTIAFQIVTWPESVWYTIEGPDSQVDTTLTKMEAETLRDMLCERLGLPS